MLRNRVREFRDLHGTTQEQLAHKAGTTRSIVNMLENDPSYVPAMTTALRLCRFFHCELGRLFYIDWDAPVEPSEDGVKEVVA